MVNVTTIDNANLDALPQDIDAAAAGAMDAALAVVQPAIARETPVRTGYLRNSERVYQRGPYIGVFAAAASYASFVANGTARQAANPFIDRGMAQAEAQAVAVYESTFERVLGGNRGR